MRRTVLITGASRGLGAEFCKQYACSGSWDVIAASRCGDLPLGCEGFGDCVRPAKLDITSAEDIAALVATTLEGRAIDVLVNNAGVALDRKATIGAVNYEDWKQTLETNVLGTHKLTAALLPALARSGPAFKVINVSSRLGSIGKTLAPLAYDLQSTDVSYRTSKAALNMATACIAVELRTAHPQACCAVLDPGWVNTDMGSKGGIVKPPLEPPEVVAGMLETIEKLETSRAPGRARSSLGRARRCRGSEMRCVRPRRLSRKLFARGRPIFGIGD